MPSKDQAAKRLLPNGFCWCGCGAETPVGSFFLAGHDKRAEAAVIIDVYGGVPQFLVAHGYGPNGKPASVRSGASQEQRARAANAISRMRQRSAEGGLDQMPDEQIDAEIRSARAGRRRSLP